MASQFHEDYLKPHEVEELERLAALRRENRYAIVWCTTIEILDLDGLQSGQIDMSRRLWCYDSDRDVFCWRYPVILPIARPGLCRMSSWPPPGDLPYRRPDLR